MSQKYLFVCGPSRSGTTAMAVLLRGHTRIGMGREKYAWRFNSDDEFQPELFTKERYCRTFDAHDSHHRQLDPYYDALYDRFDDCAYVGDKIPHIYRKYAVIRHRFPGAKIIYMAREIFAVASSFNLRAAMTEMQLKTEPHLDARRLWPVDRNWRAAVREWNQAVHATLAIFPEPNLFVVDYARLFVDSTLRDQLLVFLELDSTAEFEKQWNEGALQRQELERQRRSLLSESMRDEITLEADCVAFRRLLDISRTCAAT